MLQRLGTYISITSETGYIKKVDLTFEGDSLYADRKEDEQSGREKDERDVILIEREVNK